MTVQYCGGGDGGVCVGGMPQKGPIGNWANHYMHQCEKNKHIRFVNLPILTTKKNPKSLPISLIDAYW